MTNPRLVLVDSDSYTTSVLRDNLSRHGYGNVHPVSGALELPAILQAARPELAIFNYHAHQPESLVACSTIRLMTPQAAIVAMVSAGPALKVVREWSRQTGCIDAIVEKPLSDERFFPVLEGLLASRATSLALAAKAARLSNLVPEGALAAAEGNFDSEAELLEAAVLFTDIRGSSRLIGGMPPRKFFELLNQLLSAHSARIRRFEGSVVKYTGDGVMAIFRGMGRSYLALRCAISLASASRTQLLPFGVGVAEGLVLAGLIGDSDQAGHRRQYDIIGATVHLAARLCGMASPGEVIATRSINAVARLDSPAPRTIGSVSIRGFQDEVECVAFGPANEGEEQSE